MTAPVSGRLVAVLVAVALVIYSVMIFYTIPLVIGENPELKIFDLLPLGYSYQDALNIIDSIGESGRQAYLFIQLPLDFLYPALFAVSCTMLLIWLFNKSYSADSVLFKLAFVPFVAGVFDYLENIAVITMLNTYPDMPASLVTIASMFTVIKSAATVLFYLLLVVGVISYLRKRVRC